MKDLLRRQRDQLNLVAHVAWYPPEGRKRAELFAGMCECPWAQANGMISFNVTPYQMCPVCGRPIQAIRIPSFEELLSCIKSQPEQLSPAPEKTSAVESG